MSKTLNKIAEELRDTNKKVQLIYAFNGTGKTRLSRKFRLLVDPKVSSEEQEEEQEASGIKVMYYNAFTEDLFYWDNDLDADTNRKLLIRPNNFTDLALGFLKDQGLDDNIVKNFQHFTTDSITPLFNEEYTAQDKDGKDIVVKAYSEVTFSVTSGDDRSENNIKISKGEESNFIWCVYYSLIEQIVELLNIPEPEDRADNKFDDLEYIFIDDPISSLDENHLIELAVNLAELIRKSNGIKFIISTHNPLFYNVLYNELGLARKKGAFMLSKNEGGTFNLDPKYGDSNKSFSYHLYLRDVIKNAIDNNEVSKFHFVLLRNLYEKTANFLGYSKWSELLPKDNRERYASRIMTFYSHSTLSSEEAREPTPPEKEMVNYLFKYLLDNSKFLQEEIAIEEA
ncbi:AAA family ATPase [Tenacibaculum maritimum]|uniref:AAA family ATPase n=1 Tax=Tenacibaculum maritimum TaxID=107401 RepID=UPI0012E4C883|nr:AAA family ATPase [Tenacibaculum maritimum]MCD9586078.1 AAA family ATPase [Tenacibaculum maritimum]MCD9621887.1 AAA family ATPase [Tenacibaculum maritimum]MCD9628257.1 AAA family ATPase [Tenacibaculum maritimum]MCD9631079.1 AAA family ATPase [Tenacibaculum maritimum]MCD9634051.1 AAA family ATPase [Tenacibaculum maritimum]